MVDNHHVAFMIHPSTPLTRPPNLPPYPSAQWPCEPLRPYSLCGCGNDRPYHTWADFATGPEECTLTLKEHIGKKKNTNKHCLVLISLYSLGELRLQQPTGTVYSYGRAMTRATPADPQHLHFSVFKHRNLEVLKLEPLYWLRTGFHKWSATILRIIAPDIWPP